jgi:hypothetical protein
MTYTPESLERIPLFCRLFSVFYCLLQGIPMPRWWCTGFFACQHSYWRAYAYLLAFQEVKGALLTDTTTHWARSYPGYPQILAAVRHRQAEDGDFSVR